MTSVDAQVHGGLGSVDHQPGPSVLLGRGVPTDTEAGHERGRHPHRLPGGSTSGASSDVMAHIVRDGQLTVDRQCPRTPTGEARRMAGDQAPAHRR